MDSSRIELTREDCLQLLHDKSQICEVTCFLSVSALRFEPFLDGSKALCQGQGLIIFSQQW